MSKVSVDIGNVTRSGKGRASKITDFSIEGLDELIKAFAALPEDMILNLSAPSVEAATLISKRAKAKVRKQTGGLEKAIYVVKPGKSNNKKAYQIFAKVTFKKSAMYGVPLELGHKTVKGNRVEGRPYLRPAADESKEDVIKIMADAMNKTIDEMGGPK